MKKTQVLAALALAFALGISISFISLSNDPSAAAVEFEAVEQSSTSDAVELANSVIATAAELPAEAEVEAVAEAAELSGTVNVATTEEFMAAVASESVDTIVLTSDMQVTAVINRTAPLVINLNGYNLQPVNGTGNNNPRPVIYISRGDVTITGSGEASAASNSISAYNTAIIVTGSTNSSDTNYSTLTVDSNVYIHSTAYYAIAVNPVNTQQQVAYGVTVNMNGKTTGGYGVSVNGLITDSTNRPQINIGSSARLFNDSEQEDSTPIYAAGNAEWNIDAAILRGKAALGIKSGTFNFSDTDIFINGEETDPSAGAPGITGTSAVFQIEHHNAYADDIVININSGTYTSVNSDVFYEYGQTAARAVTGPADINITGGTFTAGGADGKIFGGDYAQNDIEISGGTFKGADATTENFQSYFTGDLKLDSNGTVVANTTNPVNPDDPTTPTVPINPSTPTNPLNPETPSDTTPTTPNQPNANQPGNAAPDTGIITHQGIISAASTIAPIIIAGLAAFCGALAYKFSRNRRTPSHAAVEVEIPTPVDTAAQASAQTAAKSEPTPEPVIERFVATPMTLADQEEIRNSIFTSHH